jgi:hypothetical protein
MESLLSTYNLTTAIVNGGKSSNSSRAAIKVWVEVDGVAMEPGEVVFNDRLQATGLTVNLTCTVPDTTCVSQRRHHARTVPGYQVGPELYVLPGSAAADHSQGRSEGPGVDRVPQQRSRDQLPGKYVGRVHRRQHAGRDRQIHADDRRRAELGPAVDRQLESQGRCFRGGPSLLSSHALSLSHVAVRLQHRPRYPRANGRRPLPLAAVCL